MTVDEDMKYISKLFAIVFKPLKIRSYELCNFLQESEIGAILTKNLFNSFKLNELQVIAPVGFSTVDKDGLRIASDSERFFDEKQTEEPGKKARAAL